MAGRLRGASEDFQSDIASVTSDSILSKRTFAADDDEDDAGFVANRGARDHGKANFLNPLSASEQRVRSVRRIIYLSIFVVGIAVAFLVYYLVDKNEVESFETQFHEDALQVLTSFTLTIDLAFGAMNAMALSMASHARSTNQSWPFVTVPDFPARAETTRALAKGLYMTMYMNVQSEERFEWEAYSAVKGREWAEESFDFQQRQNMFQEATQALGIHSKEDLWYFDAIYDYDEYNKPEEEWGTGYPANKTGPFLPLWQTSPMIPAEPPYNWDLYSWPQEGEIDAFFVDHYPIFSETYLIAEDDDVETWEEILATEAFYQAYLTTDEAVLEPAIDLMYPVIDDMPDWVEIPFESGEYNPREHKVGAMLAVSTYWRDWIKDVLSEGRDGVLVTWRSPCAPAFTYQINGPDVEYLGVGDMLHEAKFEKYEMSATYKELTENAFNTQLYTGIPLNPDPFCPISLHLYPSSLMEEEYRSVKPWAYALMTLGIFVFVAIALYFYDYFVEQRKQKLVKTAQKTDAIVSNMLPSNIRDIMYQNAEQGSDEDGLDQDSHEGGQAMFRGGPIAELYPSATIIFLDIALFTAWSSTREPTQVFQLLETVYASWDEIAYHHDVMKIETVGDCYVAVCGLPTEREDHAVCISKFARDVLEKWSSLVRKLEVLLGPDTADMKVRIGIHSGQVTAGVLRGTMARYQLFGDTVNTCARIQTSSDPGRIHLSSETADLLIAAGKEKWIRKRAHPVKLKGKGSMDTYWMAVKGVSRKSTMAKSNHTDMGMITETDEEDLDEDTASDSSQFDSSNMSGAESEPSAGDKMQRLVDWNVNVLAGLIRQILAARDNSAATDWASIEKVEGQIGMNGTVLEEFQDIIEVSKREETKSKRASKSLPVAELDDVAMEEIRSFLNQVSAMYRPNHFHNFEHASHVTSSVRKLLTRIVKVDTEAVDLSGHSYGITSDPLVQFAVVLSAIIHDCDHPGVPNATLVNENAENALIYKGKSVAEQQSVDLCWGLLMEPDFKHMRACIYQNEAELLRFRQLIVNIVMATDIADRELGALRKARWEKAFSSKPASFNDKGDLLSTNRKATIVIEHLIQASDVCHTMQHWDVFLKWNERLFFEMYSTYQEGRSSVDPYQDWYKSEIGFFDFYIIPLAKKLETCGVFGVSSLEYLKYAEANREQWVLEGQEIVEGYLEKFKNSCTS